MSRSCMRSEELTTIKYVIKNFNLLKTQFHILHSYRIAEYIEGKVDCLDKYNMSDFISLIEKIEKGNIEGCYSKGDREWNRTNEILQIADKPYCIEIISGTNLLNRFRGMPVLKKKNLTDFSLSGKLFRNSLFDPYNFMIWKMSWRKFFLYLRIKSRTK